MTLEDALIILLLDGVTSNSKEEYLRLHRKIAPFKISFALEIDGIKLFEQFIRLIIKVRNVLCSREEIKVSCIIIIKTAFNMQ